MSKIYKEEVKFENLEQGCTIRRYLNKNNANYFVVECLTCGHVGYFEDEFSAGKATGLHFADKNKYPLI